MKDGLMKTIVKSAVGGALVATPPVLGSIVAGVAKGKSAMVSGLPGPLVDGVCSLGVAVAELAVVGVVKRKAFWKAAPLAGIGVLLGATLPHLDDFAESVVRSVLGGATAAAAVSTAAQLPAATTSAPGGVPRMHGQGNTMPGGRSTRHEMGGTMPGGVEGVTSARHFGGVV